MKRLLRSGILGLSAALALFHLQLFWLRVSDGSVFEPVVAARWSATLAIVWLLFGFRRSGVSLVRGRPALSLWVLVLLLHGVAVVPGVDGVDDPATADFFLTLPVAAAAAAVVFSTGAALAALIRARCSGLTYFSRLFADSTRCHAALPVASGGARAPPSQVS